MGGQLDVAVPRAPFLLMWSPNSQSLTYLSNAEGPGGATIRLSEILVAAATSPHRTKSELVEKGAPQDWWRGWGRGGFAAREALLGWVATLCRHRRKCACVLLCVRVGDVFFFSTKGLCFREVLYCFGGGDGGEHMYANA